MTDTDRRLIMNRQLAWIDKYENDEISWEELRGFYDGCKQTLMMLGEFNNYMDFIDREETSLSVMRKEYRKE